MLNESEPDASVPPDVAEAASGSTGCSTTESRESAPIE